jgi:preprotein translocase subunit SecG
MYGTLMAVHILIAALLILVVLIQSGRSGGFSNIMGGGGGDALFSASSQQSGLRKATIIIAGIFMLTSFSLTVLSGTRSRRTILNQRFPQLPPIAAPDGAQEAPRTGGLDTNPESAVPSKAPVAPAKAPAQPKK